MLVVKVLIDGDGTAETFETMKQVSEHIRAVIGKLTYDDIKNHRICVELAIVPDDVFDMPNIPTNWA